MANVLSIDKQVAIISALAEGAGIRQIERMTGVHRDTMMRLGVRIGEGCASLMDDKMPDLSCDHLQFWEGVAEVFELIGHPKASRVYAWAHETDGKKKRHITVLHLAPVDSPQAAVKAAIVQEFRLAQES